MSVWEIAADLFKLGSIGSVLWKLALLGLGGWMLAELTARIGQGSITRLINLSTSVGGLLIVLGVVWDLVIMIARFCGLAQ